MNSFFKNAGIYLLVLVFLTTCVGTSNTESSIDVAEETTNENSYSIEAKSKNMFVNTLVIFTGTMFLAFDDDLTAMNEPLNEALSVELDEEGIRALDEQIDQLDGEAMARIERLKNNITEVYDSIAQGDRAFYEKLFLRVKMKEGINIAESEELPPGFKPLTEPLTFNELKRYIIKISVASEDTADVVINTFENIADWMQEVGQNLAGDEDMRAIVHTLRK